MGCEFRFIPDYSTYSSPKDQCEINQSDDWQEEMMQPRERLHFTPITMRTGMEFPWR
jgi:hypothetical protein